MFSTSILIDGSLVLVSGAAMLYCAQISRRLSALRDQRDGLAAAIASLNEALSASNEAGVHIRQQVDEALASVDQDLKRIEVEKRALADVLDMLDGQSARAKREVASAEGAVDGLVGKLGKARAHAKRELGDLQNAVNIANKVTALLHRAIPASPTREAAPVKPQVARKPQVRPGQEQTRQKASTQPRPADPHPKQEKTRTKQAAKAPLKLGKTEEVVNKQIPREKALRVVAAQEGRPAPNPFRTAVDAEKEKPASTKKKAAQ